LLVVELALEMETAMIPMALSSMEQMALSIVLAVKNCLPSFAFIH
jgi:hypothetical protein